MLVEGAVTHRYGEAFVNTLEASRRLDDGLKELKFVAQTYAGSKNLQRFLGSPEISPEEKQQLLAKLFGDAVGPEVMALLQLLLKKDRTEYLPALVSEAQDLAEARRGLMRGEVTTARPISSKETDAVAGAVGKLLGKRVVLERAVDPSLLGGIRVVVGTTLLDGSVKALLEEVRRQLKQVKVS